MGNPVVHFEINTRNAKRLTRFYADAFGWKVPWNEQMNYGLVDVVTFAVFEDPDGNRIGLVKAE